MIVGCFSLHLYCDSKTHSKTVSDFGEFSGETRGECYKEARKKGWTVDHNNRKAYCPLCKDS